MIKAYFFQKGIIFFLLFFASSISFGCQCATGLGSNFLNQVDYFDAIVLGRYHEENRGERIYLIIEKVYKGDIKENAIELLPGGTDCYASLFFKPGTRLIIGLHPSPYSGHPDAFMAPGCVTSILFTTPDDIVKSTSKSFGLPSLKKPRIGWIRRSMCLEKFEKKVLKRI